MRIFSSGVFYVGSGIRQTLFQLLGLHAGTDPAHVERCATSKSRPGATNLNSSNGPPTCTAPVALFTVELNWSSCSPAPARLEGTNPLLAPALADDPVFVELAFMALRFFPRETRELLPPLVACRVVEFVRFLSVFNENSEEQTASKIFTMSLSFRVQIAPLIARYNNRSETFCFGGSHKESEPREERSSKLPAFSI